MLDVGDGADSSVVIAHANFVVRSFGLLSVTELPSDQSAFFQNPRKTSPLSHALVHRQFPV